MVHYWTVSGQLSCETEPCEEKFLLLRASSSWNNYEISCGQAAGYINQIHILVEDRVSYRKTDGRAMSALYVNYHTIKRTVVNLL